jgi:hypothetical protein
MFEMVYVVLEDSEEIVGLFYSREEAIRFSNHWQEQCYDSDWDVTVTIECREYSTEEIAEILEDF